MIINATLAQSFIGIYKAILLAVHPSATRPHGLQLLSQLVEARQQLTEQPKLLSHVLASLQNMDSKQNSELVAAVKGLELKRWLYLRDTSSYSVFLDPSMKCAYGVYGLTDRIRDLTGGSGAFINTGVVRLRGRFVCDGLMSSVVWLGPQYKRNYAEAWRCICKEGQFHSRYEV